MASRHTLHKTPDLCALHLRVQGFVRQFGPARVDELPSFYCLQARQVRLDQKSGSGSGVWVEWLPEEE